MKPIRVLALDDDNHSVMFATEYGVRYNSAAEFIKECLALPHVEQYDVRGFAIIDPVDGILSDLEDDCIDDLFYFVEGVGAMEEDIPYLAAFNMLWNSSKEWWRS